MTEKKNSRFSRWFYGEEDPLLGRVEMQPQKEYVDCLLYTSDAADE